MARVICNSCNNIFNEDKIKYDEDSEMEYCPCCGEGDNMEDLKEVVCNDCGMEFKEISYIDNYNSCPYCNSDDTYYKDEEEE